MSKPAGFINDILVEQSQSSFVPGLVRQEEQMIIRSGRPCIDGPGIIGVYRQRLVAQPASDAPYVNLLK